MGATTVVVATVSSSSRNRLRLLVLLVVVVVWAMANAGTGVAGLVSIATACTTDADCSLLNGVCFQAGSAWGGRCACTINHWLDDVQWYQCTPTTSVLTVNRTGNPLYYTDFNHTFPLYWHCASSYCTSGSATSDVLLGVAYANAVVLNETVLDERRVVTRCASGLHWTPQLGAALDARCVNCTVYCAPHGACDPLDNTTCVCSAGWGGADCRTAQSVGQVQWFAHTYSDPDVFNASRTCTDHAQCGSGERCYVAARPTTMTAVTGFCFCDLGMAPSSTTSCTLAASETLYDTPIGSVRSWPVPYLLTYTSDDARQVWYQPWNTSYLDASPGDGFVATAYTDMEADSSHYVVTLQHLEAFYCLNTTQFFWNRTTAQLAYWQAHGNRSGIDGSDLDYHWHCQGCEAHCGPYANCSLSLPWNGTCTCLDGVSGTYCDRWTTVNESCRNTTCNDHGVCLLRSPVACECDALWSGTTCNVSLHLCPISDCSGRGNCTDTHCECRTDIPAYGADCGLNATTCSEARCSGLGQCTTPLQGCTCDEGYTGYDCSTHVCLGTDSVWDATWTECVCEPGRYGAHCELLTCHGNGTFNSTTGTCQCDPLYVEATACATSTCGNHGRPVRLNATTVHCVCDAPFTADAAANYTRCALSCLHNGVYDAVQERCQCTSDAFYGTRCELVRRAPLAPERRFTWRFQLVVSGVAFLFTAACILLWQLGTYTATARYQARLRRTFSGESRPFRRRSDGALLGRPQMHRH